MIGQSDHKAGMAGQISTDQWFYTTADTQAHTPARGVVLGGAVE